MIIATKTRKTILETLFADGVLVANKNFNQKKHCQISAATNLEVIMALRVCAPGGMARRIDFNSPCSRIPAHTEPRADAEVEGLRQGAVLVAALLLDAHQRGH